jgi:hypothetical protein
MTSKANDNIIKLNVGGFKYETTLDTIEKGGISMLANMFSGRHSMKPDQDGYYFIDRNGEIFKYIIKYLRDGKLNLDDLCLVRDVLDEAEYFNITGLVDLCNQKIPEKNETNDLMTSLKILFDFDVKEFEEKFNKYFSPTIIRKMIDRNRFIDKIEYGHGTLKISIRPECRDPTDEFYHVGLLYDMIYKKRVYVEVIFRINNDKSGLFKTPYNKINIFNSSIELHL